MSGTTQVPWAVNTRSDAVRSADGGGGRLQGGVARGSRVGATDGQGGGTPGLLVRRRVASGRSRVATGNQDTTTRVWDARHLGQSLAVLRGRMGAIRSLRFSRDGRFSPPPNRRISSTCMTSSRDSPSRKPWITSERRRASFSPDSEALFVGVADLTYGSVLEYQRTRRGNAAVVV